MDQIAFVCRCIRENPKVTQREIAGQMGASLGRVNTLVKTCMERHLLAPGKSCAGTYELTDAGLDYLEPFLVDGALILAAGFGSRFVPLTFETPKGLLEVFGERMIERQIRQLKEAGVSDITIAVGYLKEKFEYLRDKYQVKLLFNPEYAVKNTLATVWHARGLLKGRNMYLLFSDNWLRSNMYHSCECGAWYSGVYIKGPTAEWVLKYNKKKRITGVRIGGADDWVMYGPAYFSKEFSESFLPFLEEAYRTPGTENWYWENVLAAHIGELQMDINRQPGGQVYEFENLEELRRFDVRYQDRSGSTAMQLIARVFSVPESKICGIRCLKAGMTNKSFLFQLDGRSYICRIPGPGTELLINRKQEAAVYEAVSPLGISEHIVYMDGNTGYKIAGFYENARNADPASPADRRLCMKLLRRVHVSGIRVGHDFNLRERIDFYEGLCMQEGGTLFEDYETVRGRMNELFTLLAAMDLPRALTHIDSVADNFLILPDGTVRLIDWEYAGMCDPLVDLGMCAIYSYYNEEDLEDLFQAYFEREPERGERLRVYCYVALGGFLWSLWAVYKQSLGETFGDYTLVMYGYAKTYYKKAAALAQDMQAAG